MQLDLVVRQGMVIDGTGNPWYTADLGVRRGRIVAIDDLSRATATHTIDARGKVVAPGFVDAHAHSDYLILADPTNENKLLQGVTLDTAGHCGFSAAPLGDVLLQEWWVPEIRERFTVTPLERGREVLREHGIDLTWRTLAEYLAAVERARPATNYLNFTGQVALRLAAMGEFQRKPRAAELRRMWRLAEQSMRGGAFGVSTESGSHKGMDFETDELVELCRIAGRHGGVFSNHMRDYRENTVEAMREALSICEQARIPMIVSHLAVAGRHRGVPAEAVLGLLDAGRERGLQVTADVMPYGLGEALFFSAIMRDLLPEWATDGGAAAFRARIADPASRERLRTELLDGKSSRFYVSPDAKPNEAYSKGPLGTPGWEDGMEIVRCADARYAGRWLGDLARESGQDPVDMLFRVLEADFDAAKVVHSEQTEADLRAFVTHPWVAFGGDGAQTRAIRRPGIPNPTQYSIFPMILGRYVRTRRWLRWEDAIRKMTSLPCLAMGIRDRGMLRIGAWADITVFDPDRVNDCPSYDAYPEQYAIGIEHVIVNGVHAVRDGQLTGERGGQVLRLNRRSPRPAT